MFKNKVLEVARKPTPRPSTARMVLRYDLLEPRRQNVRVYLRGGNVRMSQKLLN